MSHYQRIVRGGELVQPGVIDTQEKFRQLFGGMDLRGLRVVDIGCNDGMMCQLAHEAGAAYVLGIDCEYCYIERARELWPHLSFDCRPARRLAGRFDVGVISAAWHYLTDTDRVLRQLSRCCDRVVLDVWQMDDGAEPQDPARYWNEARRLWVPNCEGFEVEARRWFGRVERRGRALTPDASCRWLYTLSEPKRSPPLAAVHYGRGGSGKTSRAWGYQNRDLLHLDAIHGERWVIGHHSDPSIERCYCQMTAEGRRQWLDYHRGYIERWLSCRQNVDIVIEGFDPIDAEYRAMLAGLLADWTVTWQEHVKDADRPAPPLVMQWDPIPTETEG